MFLAQLRGKGPVPPAPVATHCPGTHCAYGCGSTAGSLCGLTPTPTVDEVLATLPLLHSGEDAEYREEEDLVLINGSTMRHSQQVIAKIGQIEPGKGPISYRRLHHDQARTIVAGHRALPVHPTLDRTISVREAARIQGFEDEHVFCGPRAQQPLQGGTALATLGRAVAQQLQSMVAPRAAPRTKTTMRPGRKAASQPPITPAR